MISGKNERDGKGSEWKQSTLSSAWNLILASDKLGLSGFLAYIKFSASWILQMRGPNFYRLEGLLYPIGSSMMDYRMAFWFRFYISPKFLDPISRSRKVSWACNLCPLSRLWSGHLPSLAHLMAWFMFSVNVLFTLFCHALLNLHRSQACETTFLCLGQAGFRLCLPNTF